MGINQGPISLDQKYTQGSGHVFLTGIQALVRLPKNAISYRPSPSPFSAYVAENSSGEMT